MIVSEFSKLFDSSREPVVAVSGNSIVYYNHAAKTCLNSRLETSADMLFPDGTDTVTAGGRTYAVTMREAFDHRIYTLTPETSDDELFMYMISGRLKEHIASLRLTCSMIMPHIENNTDAKTVSHFQIIAKKSAMLHRMAGNIGYFKNFDSKSFVPVTFDAAECLRDIADSVPVFVGKRCPEIIFNCSESSVSIQADREKFELMLFQLLSNSIKYTPADGSITITLTKNDNRISVVISDTGCGISVSQLENIWSPGNAEVTPEGGAGFGLPIVQHIAKLHGGAALIASSKKGTVVTVSLPAVQPNTDNMNCYHAIYESGLSDLMLQLSDVIPAENFCSTLMD